MEESMPNVIIVGTQWGDEGKGKHVDDLGADADAVVRFQGGNNAGHTLVVDGVQTIVHLLPSGVLRPSVLNIVGNGLVVNPRVLIDEMAQLEEHGVQLTSERLLVSRRAQVIMPYHIALDKAREVAKGKDKIGTTGRGIGPCYEDKVARTGVCMGDLLDPARLVDRLEAALAERNFLLRGRYDHEGFEAAALADAYAQLGQLLAPFIGDAGAALHQIMGQGGNVLFEGAQGTFLDIDHGSYPFVTSSNTVAGNACAGAGVGPTVIDDVIGIAKAYTTRVGSGPFPTESEGEFGQQLRMVGKEFGATTGRPRRCGAFDAELVRQACRLNGVTKLVLTKLDVLSGHEKIPVCDLYQEGAGFPSDLSQATPYYTDFDGWSEDITGCRSWNELPSTARGYVEALEGMVDVPIAFIGVGPGREAIIRR